MQKQRPKKSEALTAGTGRASSEANPYHKESNMSDSKAVQVSSQPVFTFGAHSVRVVVRDGEPWFVASDVCAALDYKNTSKAVADHLDDDERMTVAARDSHLNDSNQSLESKGTHIVSPLRSRGGARHTVVINESGLYALVLRSRKPEARKFAKWVTSEVLPAIRKTGVYVGKPFAVNPGDVLTAEEQNTLRLMLKSAVEKLPKEKQAGAMVKGWSKLKAHFGVPYREIPRQEFSEAVSIIARHTAEWELVDDEIDQAETGRASAAFAMATEAAQGVQRAVFERVMAGESDKLWQHSRFVVCLAYNALTKKYDTPWCGALEHEAVTMTVPEMARRLRNEGSGEWFPREVELADLGAAIAQRQAYGAKIRAQDRSNGKVVAA